MGGCLFDNVTPDMRIYKEEIFGPVLSWCAPRTRGGRCGCRRKEYGNGVAIFTRDGDTARDFTSRCAGRHGRRQFSDPGAAVVITPSALEALRLRDLTSTDRIRSASTPQTKTVTAALASGTREGARVRHPNDEVTELK